MSKYFYILNRSEVKSFFDLNLNFRNLVSHQNDGAMKVRDILKRKGNSVITVHPQQTVLDVLKILAEHNIGGVLVKDGDKLLGIFTERDYARKIILKGKSSADIKVSDVMVTNLYTVTPDDEVHHCMRLMTDTRIRHLPVLEDGRLAGFISIGDVVKTVIDEQQQVIEHLELYISR